MYDEGKFQQYVSKISPMKPSTVKDDDKKGQDRLMSLLADPSYVGEVKYDGCHYMSFADRFFSSEGIEKTFNFPVQHEWLSRLKMPALILDGEMRYPGKTSQYATRVTGANPDTAEAFQEENGYIHYVIWDIIRAPKGQWLVNEPYDARRSYLEEFYRRYVLGTEIAKYVHLAEVEYGNKEALYKRILDEDGEGIVLKKRDSIYIMGKKPKWEWVKLKKTDEADLFIIGYDEPTVEYNGSDYDNWKYWKPINGEMRPVTKLYYMDWIGSLRLGAYDKQGNVKLVCTCSGIKEELRRDISENKEAYMNQVVKVCFMEKTEDGLPRHPKFKQFHESKLATECFWE